MQSRSETEVRATVPIASANQTVDTTQLEMSVLRYVFQTFVLENSN